MKHFELVVADHKQNGFLTLATFPSFLNDIVEGHLQKLEELFPKKEFESETSDHDFLMDVWNEDGLIDTHIVPMQFASRIAKDQVAAWIGEKPDPNKKAMAGYKIPPLRWPTEL